MFGTFEVFSLEYSAAKRLRDPCWGMLQANKKPEAAGLPYIIMLRQKMSLKDGLKFLH